MKKGFSLIEVVVAVFIMAIVLAVLMGVIGQNLRLLDRALKALKEIYILEQIAIQFQGKKLEEGESTGKWGNINYKVNIQRIEEYEDFLLYKVCVKVNKRSLCFLEANAL